MLPPITSSAYESFPMDTSERAFRGDDVYRVLHLVLISPLGILGAGTSIFIRRRISYGRWTVAVLSAVHRLLSLAHDSALGTHVRLRDHL